MTFDALIYITRYPLASNVRRRTRISRARIVIGICCTASEMHFLRNWSPVGHPKSLVNYQKKKIANKHDDRVPFRTRRIRNHQTVLFILKIIFSLNEQNRKCVTWDESGYSVPQRNKNLNFSDETGIFSQMLSRLIQCVIAEKSFGIFRKPKAYIVNLMLSAISL